MSEKIIQLSAGNLIIPEHVNVAELLVDTWLLLRESPNPHRSDDRKAISKKAKKLAQNS